MTTYIMYPHAKFSVYPTDPPRKVEQSLGFWDFSGKKKDSCDIMEWRHIF